MNTQDSVTVLKALADPTRLEIVRKLSKESSGMPSCDLVNTCSSANSLSQPAVSHHFGKLVDAGVLTEKKIGTNKRYQLNHKLLDSLGIDPNKL